MPGIKLADMAVKSYDLSPGSLTDFIQLLPWHSACGAWVRMAAGPIALPRGTR